MKHSIPASMRAVVQSGSGSKLVMAEVPVPRPGKGQVLVKMAAAPINPSDVSFVRGSYVETPKYPLIPGFEGSGTVVASGGGILASLRLDKRVTCSSSPGLGGTWAEYMVTSATRVLPIRQNLSMEQGSMLIVNPMTALAFIEIARRGRHRVMVNNAAASVLGQMLVRLCKQEKINLINIVRNSAQVKLLKEQGAELVLNSSESNFETDFHALVTELGAKLYFDAVAGPQTELLLRLSPPGSSIVLYANLSGGPIQFEPRLLIQGNKKLESFYLGHWTANQSMFQTLKAARKVQKLATNALGSEIRKRYPLEAAQEALDDYSSKMTGGKVLFTLQ